MSAQVLLEPQVPETFTDLVIDGMGSVISKGNEYRVLRVLCESFQISAYLYLFEREISGHGRRVVVSSGFSLDHCGQLRVPVIKVVHFHGSGIDLLFRIALFCLDIKDLGPVIDPEFDAFVLFMDIVDLTDGKRERSCGFIDPGHPDPGLGQKSLGLEKLF